MATWRHYPISRARRGGPLEVPAFEGQGILPVTLGTATLVAVDMPKECTSGPRSNQLHVRLGTGLANAPPKVVGGGGFYILVRTLFSVRTLLCG